MKAALISLRTAGPCSSSGNRAGSFDIWQSQLGTARFVNLHTPTSHRSGPPLDPARRSFGFTRDGAEVWFGAECRAREALIADHRVEVRRGRSCTGSPPGPLLVAGWRSRIVYVNIFS